MSGLTDEQRRRIEENKARALEKLAHKKSSAQQKPNSSIVSYSDSKNTNDASSSTSKYPAPLFKNPSSTSAQPPKTWNTSGSGQSLNLKRPNTGSNLNGSSNPAAAVQGKQNQGNVSQQPVNSFYGKKTLVKAKAILESRTHFMVECGFHAGLIALFKTMETKEYNSMTKSWSFQLSEYNKLVQDARALEPEVLIIPLPKIVLQTFPDAIAGRPTKNKIPEADLSALDSCLVETLMSFQVECIHLGIHRKGRILIADDMGLGKTIQAIALACYYRKEWPLLVVVPSSVRFDWAQQFRRWVPSLDPQSINVVLKSKDCSTSGAVNIISYDLMSRQKKELLAKRFRIIIMDESHALKNYKSARTAAAIPLLQAASRIILLSGTPALSRPMELYTQITAISPRIISYLDFGVRYCDGKKNNWGWDFSGSSNMAELQIIMEEKIMIRRLKKDVITQLPSKTRQMVLLDPSSIKIDREMKHASKRLEKAKSKDRHSVLLQYFSETAAAKVHSVRDYVLDLIEADHKFLLFAHHQEMLDAVEDLIKNKCKVGYIRIDGKTSSEQRKFFCDRFQGNEDIKIAILSICAANAGLNLTATSMVVFAELFWNPGILVQAEDRVHRIGQLNSVNIYYLVAPGTADDFIWPLVQEKLNVLGKAGLTKDDFSNTDTTSFKNPKQTEILNFFNESFMEDVDILEFAESLEINDGNSTAIQTEIKSEVVDSTDAGQTATKKETKTEYSNHQSEMTSFFQKENPQNGDKDPVISNKETLTSETINQEEDPFTDDMDWLIDDVDWIDDDDDEMAFSEPASKKKKQEDSMD